MLFFIFRLSSAAPKAKGRPKLCNVSEHVAVVGGTDDNRKLISEIQIGS